MSRRDGVGSELARVDGSSTSRLPSFPYYGFHWRIDDRWLDTRPDGAFVDPLFSQIWDAYLAPTYANLVRFHVDVISWDAEGTLQGKTRNARTLDRLTNFCRFAAQRGVRLVPILMGSGRFRAGKDKEFLAKLNALLWSLIERLQASGEESLYQQIALFQVEDEMNHPIRHAWWPEPVFARMLIEGCRSIREAEARAGLQYRAPTMVIFPADLMFLRDLAQRPREYLSAMRAKELHNLRLPGDLLAFLASELVDVIGVDLYPGLYAPLAGPHTILQLLELLCRNYGVGTPTGKRFLLAEVGCATWPGGEQAEARQMEFFAEAFQSLSDYYWHRLGREQGFLGLIWYCFNDQRIRPILWPPQEYRFGVLKTVPPNYWFATYPSTPKPAWYWLASHVLPYRQSARSGVTEPSMSAPAKREVEGKSCSAERISAY